MRRIEGIAGLTVLLVLRLGGPITYRMLSTPTLTWTRGECSLSVPHRNSLAKSRIHLIHISPLELYRR